MEEEFSTSDLGDNTINISDEQADLLLQDTTDDEAADLNATAIAVEQKPVEQEHQESEGKGRKKKKRGDKKDKDAVVGTEAPQCDENKRKLSSHSTPEGVSKPVPKKTATSTDILSLSTATENNSNAAACITELEMEVDLEGQPPSTFSEEVRRRDLLVVPQGYPKHQLTDDDVKVIENFILNRIDALKADEEGPEFRFRVWDKGYLKFACLGEHTQKFLTESIRAFRGDKPLKVITPDDLPKPPLYWVFIPEQKLDIGIFKTRLAKQNKWLKTSELRVIKTNRSTKGVSFLFSIDSRSASEIKERDGWVHYGLGTLKFHDQNKKEATTSKSMPGKAAKGGDKSAITAGKKTLNKKTQNPGGIRRKGDLNSLSSAMITGTSQNKGDDLNSSEPQFVDAHADLSAAHVEDDGRDNTGGSSSQI